ncbi:MAG TPA: peptidyl-alpha-hydroxyglycine alpha-amidating lyase family protein, partial [Pyrinomonadaceae bacterium]|nr:peptidyl-alpha-hydroxyglycine alpha-amidating lyase family protein [Pyrinomonadaceae bacterium]
MRLRPNHIHVLLLTALLATAASTAYDQALAPTNSLPNPYRSVENWAKLPDGRTWGSTAAVDIDRDGTSVWVGERCGAFAPPSQMARLLAQGKPFACQGSTLDPILKFDSSGRLVKSFGAGMLIFPHGIHVDREGNVWITDGLGMEGKGHQVFKFSPEGKLLLTLGKAGLAGTGNDEFNAPSAVVTAPNGDIFVGDGHGRDTNARIVKFSKDGKFIKTWGKNGSSPGEFDTPHAIAMDSQGRLFVGDRNNNRIQIFDQDGKFIDQWTQFSRPSGVFIDKNDVIYVSDSESESVAKNHDGWKRGIRVGKATDGTVTAFIPDPVEKATGTSAAEGVAADATGNIFGAEV